MWGGSRCGGTILYLYHVFPINRAFQLRRNWLSAIVCQNRDTQIRVNPVSIANSANPMAIPSPPAKITHRLCSARVRASPTVPARCTRSRFNASASSRIPGQSAIGQERDEAGTQSYFESVASDRYFLTAVSIALIGASQAAGRAKRCFKTWGSSMASQTWPASSCQATARNGRSIPAA